MYRRLMILGAACAVAGFSQTDNRSSSNLPPAASPSTVVVRPNKIPRPRSLLELVQRSSLIVDGTVIGQLPTITTEATVRGWPRLETHSIVGVTTVFVGSIPNSAANIVVSQTGGTSGSWNIVEHGNPLVSQGERYIFFLYPDNREGLPNTSGLLRYAVIGHWAGKVKVAGGKVAFLPSASSGLHTYDGMGVEAFLQTLQQTISHPYTDDPNLPVFPRTGTQP